MKPEPSHTLDRFMTVTRRFPSKMTILVADDEPAVRDALAGLLEIEGFSVLCCEDGVSALTLMAQQRPDVVVTDFMMPRMSGLELAIEMKASRLLYDVPIILVSGAHATLAQRESPLFAAILEKPYLADTLLQLIDQYLLPRPHTSGSTPPDLDPPAITPPLQAVRTTS